MSRWTNWLGPLDCTDNLKALWAAYEIGVAEMPGEVYKETGYQVAAFLHGLIPMLMQVLIALAATTALGGAIGALVGAFFGGAGAIPGGAIGAQAGFDLGVLILTWMGLAFLIEAIGHGLVELTSLLTQAVRRAWDAPNTPQSRQQIRLAGHDLARCGAILMRLILQGIVAWLSKSSVTGTFTRSEASMGALVAELRKSKLGPQFTGWIEANIERLMTDPRLRPHRGRASAGKQTASEAQSPSQLRRQTEPPPAPAPSPAPSPPRASPTTAAIENTAVSVEGTPVSMQRVRPGTNDTVTVVGRNMKGVEPYAQALRDKGVNVDTFNGPKISEAANAEFKALADQFGGKIPDEVLVKTKMYAENQVWIDSAASNGNTIVDVGNPFGASKSVFYDMETATIFGGPK